LPNSATDQAAAALPQLVSRVVVAGSRGHLPKKWS
jgi:hypothetical protein